MPHATSSDRLPRWSLTRWLVDPGRDVPEAVRVSLFNSLYGTVPIFLGGVFNTLLVSSAIAIRHPTALFIGWAVAELLLGMIRLPVLMIGQRAIRQGKRGPSDLYILLAMCWAAAVGFGSFICVLSGDWVVATLACLSAAAMVGGICFRNFAAPRLAGVMILLSLGPCVAAGILSGEPILLVTAIQIPLYLVAMTAAALKMNRMLVERMQAEIEKEHGAHHDNLTGLMNRAGLAAALESRDDGFAEGLAYLFLDLDGFKQVNDTLGHAAGDQLLVEVATRLRAAVPDGDVTARIGGDEFLIVSRCQDREAAAVLGERLIEALSDDPYFVGGAGVDIGVCVGASLSREYGHDFVNLIEAADQALYQAKARGRSQCVVAAFKPRLAADRGRRSPIDDEAAQVAAVS